MNWRTFVERGVALAAGRELTAADSMLPVVEALPQDAKAMAAEVVGIVTEEEANGATEVAPLPAGVFPSDLSAYLDAVESAALRAALRKTGGNRTAAAQLLGITFRQLRYRMQRLGLK